MNNTSEVLSAPLPKLLVKFTIPSLIAIASVFLFGIVDTYFASKLGTPALAAMSVSFPVLFLVTTVGLGLGVGSLSYIAPRIGKNEFEIAAHSAGHGLVLTVGVAVLIAIAGFLGSQAYVNGVGVDQEIAFLAKNYNDIIMYGALFYILPIVLSAMIRACGNATIPAVIMGIGCLLNIILDPVLMFGLGFAPRLGLAGAAYATVISAGISGIIGLIVMMRKKLLQWSRSGMWHSLKRISSVGGLSVFSNLLLPLAFALVTSRIAPLGAEVVGGAGIGMKLEPFLLALPIAMTASVPPIAGIAWGAHNVNRIRDVVALANKTVVVWQFVLAGIVFILAPVVTGIFTRAPDVAASSVLYLRMITVTYAFEGILFVVSSSWNAVGRPIRALLVNCFRMLVLILLLFAIRNTVALSWIYAVIMISNIGVGMLALWMQKLVIKSSRMRFS